MQLRFLPLLSLLAAGCAALDRVERLEARLAVLEERAAAELPRERAAERLYEEMGALLSADDLAGAREKGKQLLREYPGTRPAERAERIVADLAVLGKPAPAELAVTRWLQGEAEVSLSGAEVTLLFFWEEWDPHCTRGAVPEVMELYEKHGGQGLQVVGLTRISRTATEESVRAFLEAGRVTFPVAQETGEMAEYFRVFSVPAAAVLKDGQVVWRGRPGRITPEMIAGWLGPSR